MRHRPGDLAMFDPYHKWLGIPPEHRPPTHYQLLHLSESETDVEVIEEAGIAAKVTPVTSAEYSTAALRPAYTVLDNHKASQILGEIPHWRHALCAYLMEKGHVKCSHARSLVAGPTPM